MAKINEQAEEMSAEITASVKKAVDTLKERERELLSSIDQARWGHLIATEKDECKLKSRIAVGERAVSLASSSVQCLSGMELLEIAGPTLSSLEAAKETAEVPYPEKEWESRSCGKQ